jgi:hypothetical protein
MSDTPEFMTHERIMTGEEYVSYSDYLELQRERDEAIRKRDETRNEVDELAAVINELTAVIKGLRVIMRQEAAK